MSDKDELAKLRFHVKQLAQTIDHREHPIPSMVIELDWSEEDLDRAEDILEKHDKALAAGRFQDGALERELKETFGIGYQSVKTIINAFWRNSQWPDVCAAYAKKHPVAEFREINKEANPKKKGKTK